MALSFLTGVLLFDSRVGLILALPVGAIALFALLAVRTWSSRALIAAALIFTCLGAWRAMAPHHAPAYIDTQLARTDRSIDARVIGIPTVSTTRTKAKIELVSPPKTTVEVSLPPFPAVSDGDVIRFWAPQSWDTQDLQVVRIPLSPGRGDLFIASFAVVESQPSSLVSRRTAINAFAARSILRHVPEPAGSLTLGILNGDDSGMTDATRAAFRSAGMSHITAVSGWNVAIVAGLVALLLRRISPATWMAAAAGLAVIWSYAFVVGMEPSVLRAGGMASIVLLAHWRGRPGDLLTSLLITIAVIIALTPEIRFDMGFQLSLAATLGIVLLLERLGSRPWWQSAFAVPLVAELAVAPLLLHHLGTYSLLSPFANFAAAPLVELVMGGGIATLAAAAIHPALADLTGTFTWFVARLIIAIAEATSSVRWSSSTTATLSWPATFATYLTFILGYVGWNRFARDTRVSSATSAGDHI